MFLNSRADQLNSLLLCLGLTLFLSKEMAMLKIVLPRGYLINAMMPLNFAVVEVFKSSVLELRKSNALKTRVIYWRGKANR